MHILQIWMKHSWSLCEINYGVYCYNIYKSLIPVLRVTLVDDYSSPVMYMCDVSVCAKLVKGNLSVVALWLSQEFSWMWSCCGRIQNTWCVMPYSVLLVHVEMRFLWAMVGLGLYPVSVLGMRFCFTNIGIPDIKIWRFQDYLSFITGFLLHWNSFIVLNWDTGD